MMKMFHAILLVYLVSQARVNGALTIDKDGLLMINTNASNDVDAKERKLIEEYSKPIICENMKKTELKLAKLATILVDFMVCEKLEIYETPMQYYANKSSKKPGNDVVFNFDDKSFLKNLAETGNTKKNKNSVKYFGAECYQSEQNGKIQLQLMITSIYNNMKRPPNVFCDMLNKNGGSSKNNLFKEETLTPDGLPSPDQKNNLFKEETLVPDGVPSPGQKNKLFKEETLVPTGKRILV